MWYWGSGVTIACGRARAMGTVHVMDRGPYEGIARHAMGVAGWDKTRDQTRGG